MMSRLCVPLLPPLLLLLLAVCGTDGRAAPVPAGALSSALSPAVAPLVVRSVADVAQTQDASEAAPGDQLGDPAQEKVGDMMMMQMTFFGGNTFQLWFEGFKVHNAGTLTAACLGVAVMAALYEGLKVLRIILVDRLESSTATSVGHWVQVFLHIVQVTCSYFLMLATMTYSSWIFISVCAGAGLGYAIFGLMVSKRSLLGGTAAEHCH